MQRQVFYLELPHVVTDFFFLQLQQGSGSTSDYVTLPEGFAQQTQVS